MARIQAQGLLVGRQGLFEPPCTGQGIAAVVPVVGGLRFGQRPGGLFVVTGAIGGGRLPARILEALFRSPGVPLAQRGHALLIGAQPEILPFQRLGRSRRQQHERQQQPGQRQDQSAPEGKGGEQQGRQQQPGTGLDPLVRALGGLVALAPGGRLAHGLHDLRGGKRRLSIEPEQPPAAGASEVAQEPDIGPGDDELTPGVACQSSGQGHGGAFGRSHRHHIQSMARLPKPGGQLQGLGLRAMLVREQQDIGMCNPGLSQVVECPFQRQIEATALYRYQIGGQRGRQMMQGAPVMGWRGHQEGAGGKGIQADGAGPVGIDHILEQEPGAAQPCRPQVVAVHGSRDVEQHQQGQVGTVHGHRAFLPGGPGQSADDQHAPQGDEACQPASLAGAGRAHQHVRHQPRVDELAPAAFPEPLCHPPGQPQPGRQGQQPQRTQQMKVGKVHAWRLQSTSTRPASNRDRASGQGNRACSGRQVRVSCCTGSMRSMMR